MMNRSLVSVLVLGAGFMLLFTSFQTMGNIEKLVLDSISRDNSEFTGDGYVSLAIIYAVYALCNWLAPSVVAVAGPRGAMVIGSVTYCALLGVGAALTWNGQGVYLSRVSNSTTISRHSAIFWAMLQASMLVGNAFVWREFSGKDDVDATSRRLLFAVLLAVALLGVVLLVALPRQVAPHSQVAPLEAFRSATKLMWTPEMALLTATFLYTGLELSFFSGVYSPTVGFTNALGAKELVGLSGVCIGLGEVFGGVACGLVGSRLRRDAIVFGGFVCHATAFALALVNLPDDAVFGDTPATSLLTPPSAAVALLTAFLLGLGDAAFNTQIIAMLASVFASKSAAAFALFRFMQSLAAATSFAYSTALGLRLQLAILTTMGAVGTMAFWRVEWRTREADEAAEEAEKKRLSAHEAQ